MGGPKSCSNGEKWSQGQIEQKSETFSIFRLARNVEVVFLVPVGFYWVVLLPRCALQLAAAVSVHARKTVPVKSHGDFSRPLVEKRIV